MHSVQPQGSAPIRSCSPEAFPPWVVVSYTSFGWVPCSMASRILCSCPLCSSGIFEKSKYRAFGHFHFSASHFPGRPADAINVLVASQISGNFGVWRIQSFTAVGAVGDFQRCGPNDVTDHLEEVVFLEIGLSRFALKPEFVKIQDVFGIALRRSLCWTRAMRNTLLIMTGMAYCNAVSRAGKRNAMASFSIQS